MRLVAFETDGAPQWGVVDNDQILVMSSRDDVFPPHLMDLIAEWTRYQPEIANLISGADRVPLSEVVFLPPIHAPEKMLCVGRNYADHAIEQGAEVPAEPIIFNKLASTLIGHQHAIRIPPISQKVDYEGELVVVIGRAGRSIEVDQAMDHVFGYTLGNDVTARDWQKGHAGGQWLLGKTFDTFAPVGPWIVTKDSIDDPGQLDIRTTLNDLQVQSDNTRRFLFPIDRLISHLSQFVTLRPGDLIFTGTPEGVGVARNPPLFLKSGDRITVDIKDVGELTNIVLNQDE